MYLDKIKNPSDVKKIPLAKLPKLCDEIRDELISTVSNTGGHLASNLGVVELTVAIHKVFKSPQDSILFDVGHQSYVHKMLTGRYDRFSTIRTENGLSGFMNPNESCHDPFISGHSSASLSAGFGIAKANRLKNKNGKVVCVIGDGALTGGMAYEALNNIGRSNENMIIILNDNEMSISQNVGAIAKYLSKVRTRNSYISTKAKVKNKIGNIPVIGKPTSNVIEKTKSTIKNVIFNQNMFESLGFYYLGPVDGHDLASLIEVMRSAKSLDNRPVVIHAVTKKGKGYNHAENNPDMFHGVSSFDYKTGYQKTSHGYSDAFGKSLCEIAEKDENICAITAAMADGTGLNEFSKRFSDRFFDVGIAEQHAVAFAAGLASKGMVPVFAVYSSFLQRAYDQIIHDCSIIKQHVVLAVDRAGIVGRDGATHQGMFDVSFLSAIPGVTVFAPSNYSELDEMLKKAIYDCDGVCVIRYPRASEPEKAENNYRGDDFCIFNCENYNKLIVSYGNTFNQANGLDVALCKLNVLNITDKLIHEVSKFNEIYFFEEGIKNGGIGQILGEKLLESGYNGKYKHIGVEEFVSHAEINSSLKKYSLDHDSMLEIISGD